MSDVRPDSPRDALIVGAGLAGLYMLHRLRQQGASAHVYEGLRGLRTRL